MSSRELEDVILSLAAGDMSEEIFSEWIRDHTFSIKQPRFNRETESAIMEARDILAGRQEARRYSSTKELFDELDAEDE